MRVARPDLVAVKRWECLLWVISGHTLARINVRLVP